MRSCRSLCLLAHTTTSLFDSPPGHKTGQKMHPANCAKRPIGREVGSGSSEVAYLVSKYLLATFTHSCHQLSFPIAGTEHILMSNRSGCHRTDRCHIFIRSDEGCRSRRTANGSPVPTRPAILSQS